MNTSLSRATESDLDEIAALVNSAYRGEGSRKGWTTEADYMDGQRTSSEDLRRDIDDPANKTILTLKENSKIIACVFLERFQSAKGVGCYLGMLTVSPYLQAAGLGRTMLQRAEEFARGWGANHIILGVIQLRSELIAWYERRGYSKTGTTKAFPYHDPMFGIPKREDLHFIMFEKSLEPAADASD